MLLPNSKEEYYTNPFIMDMLNLVVKHREIIFYKPDGEYKCNRPHYSIGTEYLLNLMTFFKIFERNYNMYVSVSKLKWIPPFEKTEIRKPKVKLWFSTIHKFIYEYDLLLDFDNHLKDDITEEEEEKEFENMFNEYYNFVLFLNKQQICFFTYPSSTAGFHIIIPSENFTNKKTFLNTESFKIGFDTYIGMLARNIKELFNLNYVDLNGIGTQTKIRKCEFSYNNGYSIFPLIEVTKNKDDYKILKINDNKLLDKIETYKEKGTYYINNFSEERNKNNMENFLNKFQLIKYNEVV